MKPNKNKNTFTISKKSFRFLDLYALFFSLLLVPAIGIYCLNALNTMTPISVEASYRKPEVEKVKENKVYAYNERVPEEIIKEEIKTVSKLIGCDENLMLRIAKCESGYDNLAWNTAGTATGVYQYLIGTWQGTQSWKQHRYARTDYKANIREACLDIANGEINKWSESRACWK
jgi:hypothetical protein